MKFALVSIFRQYVKKKVKCRPRNRPRPGI